VAAALGIDKYQAGNPTAQGANASLPLGEIAPGGRLGLEAPQGQFQRLPDQKAQSLPGFKGKVRVRLITADESDD
jgi:hypothetical protein